MEVEFVVLLEVQVDIYVSSSHWDDFDECFPWIQLKCHGDLDQNLDDFVITGAKNADKSKGAPNPLDDSLVPYLKKWIGYNKVDRFFKVM